MWLMTLMLVYDRLWGNLSSSANGRPLLHITQDVLLASCTATANNGLVSAAGAIVISANSCSVCTATASATATTAAASWAIRHAQCTTALRP